MATKEDIIAGLMERLDNPVLTQQEFNELTARIEAVQKISA